MIRNHKEMFRLLPLVAVMTSTFSSSALLAAENQPTLTAQAQPVAQQSGRIEEIVITARKDEESQQTVPVAVTALSDAALKAQAVTSLYDMAGAVPGLLVAPNSQGGRPTMAIRAAKADNGTSDTVTAYVDDVPMVSPKAVVNMTYDMASITTLKGPQGTFFGTSTTGGAVVFRPNKPTDTFEGYAELGIGNWGRKTFEGMVNIPINDVLQVRVAGNMVKRDGFVKNESPYSNNELADEDSRSMRLSVRLKPNADLMNDLVVNYYHEDSEYNPEVLVGLRNFNFPTFLGIPIPVNWAYGGVGVPGDKRTVALGSHPTFNRAENIDFGNTTTYQINDSLSIKNVIGYQKTRLHTAQDNDATIFPILNGQTENWFEQWSEEFSVDSKFWDGRLRNKTGVFYSKNKYKQNNQYYVQGLPFNPADVPDLGFGDPGSNANEIAALNTYYPLTSNARYLREVETQAIYTQFAYDITDTLTATLGARYTWDKGDYRASNRTAFPGLHGPIRWGDYDQGPCSAGLANYKNFDAANCLGYQDFKTSAPSYVFTLENKFSDRQMVYATIRHGYLVGGFNNQVFTADQSGQVFLPEEVTDTEFGLKSDWELFGRPIRTNAALFFGHYKNQQRVQFGTTSTGVSYIAVANAGATTFYGWDLDMIYDVTDWLRLTAAWNHVIAEYDNFKAPLNTAGVTGGYVDMQGTQLSQTPEDVFSLSATVTWPLSTDKGTLQSTLSYYWRDDIMHHDSPVYNCTYQTPPPYNSSNLAGECQSIIPGQDFRKYDVLEDYAIVNFTTEWKNVMGSSFDVRFWVKNLFDKEYAIYGSNRMTQLGQVSFVYGNPREYGLNVRYNF